MPQKKSKAQTNKTSKQNKTNKKTEKMIHSRRVSAIDKARESDRE